MEMILGRIPVIARFTELLLAESFVDRSFTTTGTSLRIVLGDDEEFWVTLPRHARELEELGYELAQ